MESTYLSRDLPHSVCPKHAGQRSLKIRLARPGVRVGGTGASSTVDVESVDMRPGARGEGVAGEAEVVEVAEEVAEVVEVAEGVEGSMSIPSSMSPGAGGMTSRSAASSAACTFRSMRSRRLLDH
jgi:hypothetical protein